MPVSAALLLLLVLLPLLCLCCGLHCHYAVWQYSSLAPPRAHSPLPLPHVHLYLTVTLTYSPHSRSVLEELVDADEWDDLEAETRGHEIWKADCVGKKQRLTPLPMCPHSMYPLRALAEPLCVLQARRIWSGRRLWMASSSWQIWGRVGSRGRSMASS